MIKQYVIKIGECYVSDAQGGLEDTVLLTLTQSQALRVIAFDDETPRLVKLRPASQPAPDDSPF